MYKVEINEVSKVKEFDLVFKFDDRLTALKNFTQSVSDCANSCKWDNWVVYLYYDGEIIMTEYSVDYQ